MTDTWSRTMRRQILNRRARFWQWVVSCHVRWTAPSLQSSITTMTSCPTACLTAPNRDLPQSGAMAIGPTAEHWVAVDSRIRAADVLGVLKRLREFCDVSLDKA